MTIFRWNGFVKTGTLCSSVIHFFGSASGVSAPYPMNCSLTVFGNGIEKKTVILEGMRLYQPDGVKIDDIFPTIKESSKTLGILIELSCTQSKIDLSVTNCFIEINEQGARSVYPAQYINFDRPEELEFCLSNDSQIVMSTLCIDSKSSTVREILSEGAKEEVVESPFGPQTIRHFSLPSKEFENCGIFLCSHDKTLNTLISVSSI